MEIEGRPISPDTDRNKIDTAHLYKYKELIYFLRKCITYVLLYVERLFKI